MINDHWDLDMVSPPIFINDNLNKNKIDVVWALENWKYHSCGFRKM